MRVVISLVLVLSLAGVLPAEGHRRPPPRTLQAFAIGGVCDPIESYEGFFHGKYGAEAGIGLSVSRAISCELAAGYLALGSPSFALRSPDGYAYVGDRRASLIPVTLGAAYSFHGRGVGRGYVSGGIGAYFLEVDDVSGDLGNPNDHPLGFNVGTGVDFCTGPLSPRLDIRFHRRVAGSYRFGEPYRGGRGGISLFTAMLGVRFG